MFDAAIIGGSFAGLSAAMQLGRASRSVIVIDDGQPRNRTSRAAHGVPGWDGVAPGDILARFRADLSAYPTVRLAEGRVRNVKEQIDGFTLELETAPPAMARRIVLAHGVRDILPEVPGLAEGWGRTVLHCPYCHGYEVKGRPLAVLATGPMAVHQARMLRADWSDRVTLLTGLAEGLDVAALEGFGIEIDPRRLEGIDYGDGLTVFFAEGAPLKLAAIFLTPAISLAGSPAEALGLALTDGPMGSFVRVGPMMQTSRSCIFAAGDLARAAPSVNFAVGDGAAAGAACHQSLIFSDLIQPIQKEAA